MFRITHRRLGRPLLGLALLGAAAAPSAGATTGPRPLGHTCTLESIGVRFCASPIPTSGSDRRVRSWDGAALQVDVTLPRSGRGPWPTIVMLPGYGGSDGVSWEASPGSSGSNEGEDYNNLWFAKHGYAVVTMNFRGVGYSCGPAYPQTDPTDTARTADPAACNKVSFEFGDQRYDARDVQWVLGLLVDEGIAKANALGVTGESLGSLVTLEVALLYNRVRLPDGRFATWRSRGGTRLHLSAAYPIWAVSDLMDGVAPNGRFLSFAPRTAVNDANPIGAMKLSAPAGIAGEAPVDVWTDPQNPTGFNLLTAGTYGELAAPNGPGAAALVSEIRNYHQSVGMPLGSGVAPLLVQDGWADMLVNGASQALRLADYLKAAAPLARVSLQLADVGHAVSSNKDPDMEALDRQATSFLDHYLKGRRGGPAPGAVTAYTSACPSSARSAGPFEAPGLAALDPGAVRFSSAPAQTVAGGGDPSIGPRFDPILGTAGTVVQGGPAVRCPTFTATDWPGTAVYTHPVTRTFTMLGLPTLRMHVVTTGNEGQLDGRLWDVAPDGKETFVTRGTYALADNQHGTITWQLWGGGYRFRRGDTIRVELLAEDVPIQRPSRGPVASTVSDVTIELPAHERPDGGEITAPSLAVSRARAQDSAAQRTYDGARLLTRRSLGPRAVELTIATPAFKAPTRVQVFLPRGYAQNSGRHWPVVYYLHGMQGDEKRFAGWYGDLIKTVPAVFVAPDGGQGGFYSDWYNGGAGGPPMYETYDIRQLIPLIDGTFRTVASRAGRALIGESMGGYGVLTYAARHPDMFGAVASMSGFVDTNTQAGIGLLSAAPLIQGGAPNAIYGPRATEEVRWHGHNPTDLADNLRGIDLQVRTAEGIPTTTVENGDPTSLVGCTEEAGVYGTNVNLERALRAAHIPHVFKDYGAGCHSIPNFRREFTASLPGIEWSFTHPRPVPASFDFLAIEPHFGVWGWQIDADPRRALEFLTLRDAGRSGVTLTGSGTTTVTTAPYFRGVPRVAVSFGGHSLRIRPDRAGRLRFSVDLGPAHANQQYTEASRTAGEGKPGYFVTRRVTFTPGG